MARGYVYLLGHTAMPTYYKIGMSGDDPHKRARQLAANSGVPHEFSVICFIQVEDAAREERDLHDLLADFRHSYSREFFRFASVHLPWVRGLFEHHPRALQFSIGKQLLVFGGLFGDPVNPWAHGSDEPEMTEYAPDYAYFDTGD